MDFVQFIMLGGGLIGIGYGVFVISRGHLEIYHVRSGEFLLYTGQSAQLIGLGIAVAGLGAALLGGIGFTPFAMFIGILCSAVYFISRSAANQLQADDTDFSVPSKDRSRQ